MIPEAYADFVKVCDILENHYRDMQDMEFTVEHGKLYMLQCRNGKRTAPAALKIACDLVDEGMISEQEAVAMIDPRNLDTLLHPQFDPAALKKAAPAGKALPASPGAACGKIVFTAEDAKQWANRGEKVVLVRLETSPEDIEGMKARAGHPDRPRRHDLPRGGRRPRHGQVLRLRLRRRSRWTRPISSSRSPGKRITRATG